MNQQVDGAVNGTVGRVQAGVGRLTGDVGTELKGRFNEVKGATVETYGKALDRLDGLVDRAPTEFQEPARQGLDFARRKPLVTTGILAGVLMLLLGALGGSRRR